MHKILLFLNGGAALVSIILFIQLGVPDRHQMPFLAYLLIIAPIASLVNLTALLNKNDPTVVERSEKQQIKELKRQIEIEELQAKLIRLQDSNKGRDSQSDV